MDNGLRTIPLYLGYKPPWLVGDMNGEITDLEYLQQMYSAPIRTHQKRINEIIDKLDYEGSMIYDEYPDRWQIYRMAENILEIMKREDAENENPIEDRIFWEQMADIIQILLCQEIYKRRRDKKRRILKF